MLCILLHIYTRESILDRAVVAMTTSQLHSRKPEFRFYACLNPACGGVGVCDGEDL